MQVLPKRTSLSCQPVVGKIPLEPYTVLGVCQQSVCQQCWILMQWQVRASSNISAIPLFLPGSDTIFPHHFVRLMSPDHLRKSLSLPCILDTGEGSVGSHSLLSCGLHSQSSLGLDCTLLFVSSMSHTVNQLRLGIQTWSLHYQPIPYGLSRKETEGDSCKKGKFCCFSKWSHQIQTKTKCSDFT